MVWINGPAHTLWRVPLMLKTECEQPESMCLVEDDFLISLTF